MNNLTLAEKKALTVQTLQDDGSSWMKIDEGTYYDIDDAGFKRSLWTINENKQRQFFVVEPNAEIRVHVVEWPRCTHQINNLYCSLFNLSEYSYWDRSGRNMQDLPDTVRKSIHNTGAAWKPESHYFVVVAECAVKITVAWRPKNG